MILPVGIVSYIPPSCRPALGLQLELSGRPCWGQAARICFAVWACSVWGSFVLRAALYQQLDKDPRLGHDLRWLGLAAPGWAKEGAATPAQQRHWAGEPRSCMWRDSVISNHGAVPKLAIPERREFLKSLTLPSLPQTSPASSCSEERFVSLWGCCRSLCQPSQGDTPGLPRQAERTVKKVP